MRVAIAIGISAALLFAGAAAGPRCTAPKSEAALRTAALQQLLMVSALTCRKTRAYNNFVLSHRGELQQSDRDLLSHFVRLNAATGDAEYNAFKTWLANAWSMRSLRDPQFCAMTEAAFAAAADRPLAHAIAERWLPIDIAEEACEAGRSYAKTG